MISLVIFSLMFVMMLRLLGESTATWSRAEQRVDTEREARVVQHLMARDLESMVQPMVVNEDGEIVRLPAILINGNRWSPPGFIFGDDRLAPAEHGDTIFFVTTQSASALSGDRSSDLAVVGYYLAYTIDQQMGSTTGTTRSYNLHRYFWSGPEVLEHLANYYTAILTGEQPTLYLVPDDSLNYARPPAPSSGAQLLDEVVGRNILNFKVSLYQQPGPMDALELVDHSDVDWPIDHLPQMVEVSFDVFSHATALTFTTREDWHAGGRIDAVQDRETSHYRFRTHITASQP